MGSVAIPQRYDVLIIGAGLSGICSLYHIRKQFPSWRVRVLEAGSSAGGTWYFNRYPGARFDCESISYCYSWDEELLDEWHWKEAFSAQPETLRYIDRVCEKHDLNKDIRFDTRIQKAQWKDSSRTWLFTDVNGNEFETTFFVSCLGFLSAPTLPNIPGVRDFAGESFHTARWPESFDLTKDLAGKKVGVVGTGATGIQVITELAKERSIKSLNVYQRTATWSAPLRNSEIPVEKMEELKRQYSAVFKLCDKTPLCFMHQADPRNSLDVSEEERIALWEKLYLEPGFGKWLGVFKDTYTDRQANTMYSEFMAKKIRERVNDSKVADKLIPQTHGFGTRRVPLESGYFEAFNMKHVKLVDLKETPIQRITANGVALSSGEQHDLDALVYATGFDAITGAFSAIDWQTKSGRPLTGSSKDKNNPVWVDFNPRTFLGIMAPAMPNTFMVLGPHQPFGNATRSIEHAVGVVCELLQHCKDNCLTYAEPTEEAVEQWTQHVVACSQGSLSNEVDSWMTGVNTNVPGKTVRNVARYAGNAVEYRRRCTECKSNGWEGIEFR